MPSSSSNSAQRRIAIPRQPARTLALLFLSLILLGGVLLHLPICVRNEPLDWSAAYFTATSAVCVTGLSVFDVRSTLSPVGQIVLLLLIQVGGLGYMLASTFLLLLFGREPRLHERLLLRSTLGQVTLRDTRSLVLRAVLFTLAVEALGAAILTARFLSLPEYSFFKALWHGVFHAVSAFCNAGFDLFGVGRSGQSSLAHFRDDWVINLTIAGLIIFGGLGFAVYQEVFHRWRNRNLQRTPFSLHARVVLQMTMWLIIAGFAMVLLTEWTNPNTLGKLALHDKILAGFFQSVTLRTAGFASLDFGALRSITLVLCGLWMFIGAGPGGTAGGVKITTFTALLATVGTSLRGRTDVEIFHRRLPPETVQRALVLIFVSFGAIIVGMMLLTFTEPDALIAAGHKEHLFMRLQFETISAFGTVGLSTGITAHLTDAGRIVLMTLMFLGRLGPVTAAAALAVPHPPLRRHLPEEEFALG